MIYLSIIFSRATGISWSYMRRTTYSTFQSTVWQCRTNLAVQPLKNSHSQTRTSRLSPSSTCPIEINYSWSRTSRLIWITFTSTCLSTWNLVTMLWNSSTDLWYVNPTADEKRWFYAGLPLGTICDVGQTVSQHSLNIFYGYKLTRNTCLFRNKGFMTIIIILF